MQMRNLSSLNYAQGYTAWHYRLPEGDERKVTELDYWKSAASLIVPGDTITVIGTAFYALLQMRPNRIAKLAWYTSEPSL